MKELLRATILTRKEHGDLLPSLLARQCCDFYAGLAMPERHKFLTILGRDFDINRERAAAAARKYLEVKDDGSDRTYMRAEEAVRHALRPLYEKFFEQINHLPGGMHFLVNLRADVLAILAKEGNDPYLRGLDISLKTQLQAWFGIGFLDLDRITWNTPATILEKIVHYEAVHTVPTWQALKQRLGPGRLCYAFFHRGMPQVPLTFVQIALTAAIPEDVHLLLNDLSPEVENPSTAIFYSISSSQKGLAGVDLGNFLIKRVVRETQALMPTVTTFCTLSPIPRFRAWLETRLNGPESPSKEPFLLPGEETALRDRGASGTTGADVLKRLLADDANLVDPQTSGVVKPILLRLCARYMLLEKRRSFALDPVCNFHIRNGACLQRLNWMGDRSAKGLRQSYGIMVNFNYRLPQIELNNQTYLFDGSIAVIPTDDGPDHYDEALSWAIGAAGGAVPAKDGILRVHVVEKDRAAPRL
ncbi:hypothetical protein HKX48_003015 [Thoreauomyces humboldtii]|nr:hypothetical protein HKX48_003015 [Thoreauomyces humboldtii]